MGKPGTKRGQGRPLGSDRTERLDNRYVVERLLDQLAPAKQPAYRRIAAGDLTFRANYRAADKDLPICSECGRNTSIVERLDALGLSRCCFASIEQDQGA